MTNPVRIAAVGDIHYGKHSQGALHSLFVQVNTLADVLVLCGDLTDYGLPEEAQVLVRDLAVVKVPIVAVLGNHDFEAGQTEAVSQILTSHGITMLDGDACEINGIGFAGVKGFAGGFGRGTLGSWGEPMIKQFVQEALDEALKLESALARLRSPHRVAVLHYAPIQATVEGEPEVIYPYLGSGRLEEPLNRYRVDVVVHGHAHHGSPAGHTQTGIPVYNVSHSLLERSFPDQPSVRIIEFSSASEAAATAHADQTISQR